MRALLEKASQSNYKLAHWTGRPIGFGTHPVDRTSRSNVSTPPDAGSPQEDEKLQSQGSERIAAFRSIFHERLKLMRAFITAMATTTILLGLTPLAHADSVIGTPLLDPPNGGRVSCGIVNTSSVDTIEVTFAIYDFAGTENFGPITLSLLPLNNIRSAPFDGDDRTSHCIVTVRNRDSRDIRVTLMAYDGNDAVVAAVSGQ
jgi:hypothetical protein